MTPLTDEADQVADRICLVLRMSKTELVQRLLFFADAAPVEVQQVITGVSLQHEHATALHRLEGFIRSVISGEVSIKKPAPRKKTGRPRKQEVNVIESNVRDPQELAKELGDGRRKPMRKSSTPRLPVVQKRPAKAAS